MSAAPFDVKLIAARLREAVPTLRLVGLAADYSAVNRLQDFVPPCAYVLLASEKAQPQPTGHAPPGQNVRVHQMVQAMFGVVHVVRNYREQRGEQAVDELSTMLDRTRKAIVGFVPNLPGARACEFVGGKLEDYDAGTSIWIDMYRTQHSISNQ